MYLSFLLSQSMIPVYVLLLFATTFFLIFRTNSSTKKPFYTKRAPGEPDYYILTKRHPFGGDGVAMTGPLSLEDVEQKKAHFNKTDFGYRYEIVLA